MYTVIRRTFALTGDYEDNLAYWLDHLRVVDALDLVAMAITNHVEHVFVFKQVVAS